MSQADVDHITAAEAAASAALQQNMAAYGDTFQARTATIQGLHGMPGVAQVRLLEDGLSIGIQYTSGARDVLFLNHLDDSAAASPGAPAPNPVQAAAQRSLAPARGFARSGPAAAAQPLACNMPQRPIVWSNNVMI
jgi:hypothetical protein